MVFGMRLVRKSNAAAISEAPITTPHCNAVVVSNTVSINIIIYT